MNKDNKIKWSVYLPEEQIEEQMKLYRLYRTEHKHLEAELILRLCANIQANKKTTCLIVNTTTT